MIEPALALYGVGLVAATVLNAAIIPWVWRRDGSPASRWYMLIAGAAALWGVCSIARTVVAHVTLDPGLTLTALLFSALFANAVVPAWFVFSVQFTGRTDLLTRPVKALLVVAYAAPILLHATNRYHGLMWTGADIVEQPFPHLVVEPGPALILSTLVSFLLTLASVVVVGRLALFSRRMSRRQVAAVVLSPVPAWALQFASSTELLPVGLDYSLVGTAIAVVLLAWALFGHDLFAVPPVARDTVVRNVRDGIVTVDRQCRVVDFNDAATDIYPGIADAVGEPLAAVAPGLVEAGDTFTASATAPEPTTDGGRSAHAEGVPFADEVTRDDGGQRRVYTVGASPITADDGLRGYTLVLRDVTERRRREEQLEQETEQLDQFAATVSHDLRNPLTVAQGYLGAATEDLNREDLAEAAHALDRMEDIIDDALALARDGRAVTDREPVELVAVAREAWRTSRTAEATLSVEAPETLSVYGDRARIRRLFENLFRNSVDHGRADVTVRVTATGDGFAVEDDGPGIPEERREEVFDHGVTTSDDGTGLGLAIVESIADAHGWTVSLEESDAGGARFRFGDIDRVGERPTAGAPASTGTGTGADGGVGLTTDPSPDDGADDRDAEGGEPTWPARSAED